MGNVARKPSPKVQQIEGLSTGEVARILEVSAQRVRQYRTEKRLLPSLGTPEHPVYTLAAVEEFKARRYVKPLPPPPPPPAPEPAAIRTAVDDALAAFEHFRQGATLETVVRALRLPPARVRALFREWSTPLAAIPTVARENGIREREASRRADLAREAREKASRALDADYDARMRDLDREVPKPKRRTFEFSSKARNKRHAEHEARVTALRERIKG